MILIRNLYIIHLLKILKTMTIDVIFVALHKVIVYGLSWIQSITWYGQLLYNY